MSKIVWNLNNFTGWEADNARQWPQGSFRYWEWVDVRRQPWEVSLSKALVDTTWTFTDTILYIDNIDKYGWSWIVVACNDWKVYLNWTLKQTISTWTNAHNRIIGMAYMNVSWADYLYYITQTSSWGWEIHRSTMDLATWSIWHISFTANSWAWNTTGKAPTVSEATRFIFGIWWRVFNVDNAEVLTTKLTLSAIEDVLWITVFQNQYRVYTNQENELTNQYFWDWTSTDYNYKTEWVGIPLQAVVNDWWYDYTIAWDTLSSDFYQIAWTQRQEIRVNNIDWARAFDKHISTRQWLMYLSWSLTRVPWIPIYWVYVYGSFYPWYPKAMILEHPISSNNILWHTHIAQSSYFACQDDKVYKVGYATNTYNTTWYIQTLKYDWWTWNAYIKKQIDYAYIGFDNLNASRTIKIYAIKNGWTPASEVLLKTLDGTHFGLNWVRIDRTEFQALWLWDFFDLEYRIVLTWTTSSSPVFRWIETYITTWIQR